jgi:hypothetical protein
VAESSDHWLDGFESYMVEELHLDPKLTVAPNMTELRRFLQILHIEFPSDISSDILAGPHWIIGFISAMSKTKLHAKMFALEILSSKFSWSRKMFSTFKHLVEYARINAISERFSHDKELIEDIKVRFKGLTTTHTDAKIEAQRDRIEKDADRIDEMPSIDEQVAACKQAIYDMRYLHYHTRHQPSLTKHQKAYSQNIAQGVIYLSSKAGRGGEWSKITTVQARDELHDKQRDYLTAYDHKIKKKRGAVVKVFQPSCLVMLDYYLDLPGMNDTTYLFECSNNVASRLKAFSKVYFGRKCIIGSNFVRKLRSNNRKTNQERAARALGAWEDGHALITEENVYIAMSSKEKANLARKNLELEIPKVDLPTDEEFESMTTLYFARRRRGDGGISIEELHGVQRIIHNADDHIDSDRESDDNGDADEYDEEDRPDETEVQEPPQEHGDEYDEELRDKEAHIAADDQREDIERNLESLIDTAIDADAHHKITDDEQQLYRQIESLIDDAIDAETPPKRNDETTQSRIFHYNAEDHKFEKREVEAPNLIKHQPLPTYAQKKMDVYTGANTCDDNGFMPNDLIAISMHSASARGIDFGEMEKRFMIKEMREYNGHLTLL